MKQFVKQIKSNQIKSNQIKSWRMLNEEQKLTLWRAMYSNWVQYNMVSAVESKWKLSVSAGVTEMSFISVGEYI